MSIVLLNDGGGLINWQINTLLSYNISQISFDGNPLFYNSLRDQMIFATKEWESICNVKFEYMPQFDNLPLTNGWQGPSNSVLFSIKYTKVMDGQTYATSFFPYTPSNRRLLIIYPLYFSGKYDQIGLLRHEIGHMLGLQHECDHPDAPCGFFDPNVPQRALTPFDPFSVMHSPSDELHNYEMRISELDKQGAQLMYGAPFQNLIS